MYICNVTGKNGRLALEDVQCGPQQDITFDPNSRSKKLL